MLSYSTKKAKYCQRVGIIGGFMEKIEFDAVVESLSDCKKLGTINRKGKILDFYVWNNLVLYHSKENYCVVIGHLRFDVNFKINELNHANKNFCVRGLEENDWNPEEIKINEENDFDIEYYSSRIFWLYPRCYYIFNKETLLSVLGVVKDDLENGVYRGDIDEIFFYHMLPKVEEKINELKEKYALYATYFSTRFVREKAKHSCIAQSYITLLDKMLNPFENPEMTLDITKPEIELEVENADSTGVDKNIFVKIVDKSTGSIITFEKDGNTYVYSAHLCSKKTVIDLTHQYVNSINGIAPVADTIEIHIRELGKYYSVLDADYLYNLNVISKFNFDTKTWKLMNDYEIENFIRIITMISVLVRDTFEKYMKPAKKHIILPKNKKGNRQINNGKND